LKKISKIKFKYLNNLKVNNLLNFQLNQYQFLIVLSYRHLAKEKNVISKIFTGFFVAVVMTASQAANVAFFNDPAFVDVPQEGANLRATLTGRGHTVTDITGSTLADFTTGLTGNTVLVIPELQNGNLNAALDAATKTLISTFVTNGGVVQVHGGTTPNDTNFLNGVFGYSVTTAGATASGSSTLTSAAASTPYASGPATVTHNSATTLVPTSSLPSNAVSIYTDGANTVMFTVPVGAGQVVYMGWDWFGAPPQGASDGGWLDLASLVSTASAAPATPAAIPTLSEWAMIFLASLMAMFAIRRVRRQP
jgi:hypothetical protein